MVFSVRKPHWMLSPTVVECEIPPPVPVIVNVELPGTAFLFVDILSVELPEPFTLVGLNVELVRFGAPLRVMFTAAEKGP